MSNVKKQTVSDTDKLFTAKTFKTEGNEFHKKKEFKKAIGKYHRALLQLKAIGQSKSAGLGAFMSDEDLESMGYSSNVTEEVQAETTQLLADCYNNLAGTDLSKSAQDEMAITLHPSFGSATWTGSLTFGGILSLRLWQNQFLLIGIAKHHYTPGCRMKAGL